MIRAQRVLHWYYTTPPREAATMPYTTVTETVTRRVWVPEGEITTSLLWDKAYDKYSRSKIQLDRIHVDAAGHWVQRDRDLAVIVTLPRRTADLRPAGHNYLLNVRSSQPGEPGTVTYHASRKAAKAHAERSL